MTTRLDPTKTLSLWTYEYAFGYLFGPILGAMVAGCTSNMIAWILDERAEFAKKKEEALRQKENESSMADISYSFGDAPSM